MVAQRAEIRARVRAELDVADGDLLAVTVANLRSEKGYDVLLETARRVGEQELPVSFVAAGQGDLAEELEAQRQALGLGDRFRFLGHRRDALALLTAADLVSFRPTRKACPSCSWKPPAWGPPLSPPRSEAYPR